MFARFASWELCGRATYVRHRYSGVVALATITLPGLSSRSGRGMGHDLKLGSQPGTGLIQLLKSSSPGKALRDSIKFGTPRRFGFSTACLTVPTRASVERRRDWIELDEVDRSCAKHQPLSRYRDTQRGVYQTELGTRLRIRHDI